MYFFHFSHFIYLEYTGIQGIWEKSERKHAKTSRKHEISQMKRNFNGKMNNWYIDYNNAKKDESKMPHSAGIIVSPTLGKCKWHVNLTKATFNSVKQLSQVDSRSAFGYLFYACCELRLLPPWLIMISDISRCERNCLPWKEIQGEKMDVWHPSGQDVKNNKNNRIVRIF